MSATFTVKIREASKELSAYDRVKYKGLTDAIRLDEAANEGVEITPDFYVILDIHNDKGNPPDYVNYVIVDKDGTKYVTGSASFWNAFMEIHEELEGSDYTIKAYKCDSKNYKDKQFITCSLV